MLYKTKTLLLSETLLFDKREMMNKFPITPVFTTVLKSRFSYRNWFGTDDEHSWDIP